MLKTVIQNGTGTERDNHYDGNLVLHPSGRWRCTLTFNIDPGNIVSHSALYKRRTCIITI